MKEKWKKVQEFPNYSVSTEGRLRNDVTKHIRNFDEQKPYNRYAVASFKVNGKPVRRKLHRLVAAAWMENPDNLPEINHINGDKYDNRVENLEWCTHSENMKHAYRTGICPPPPSPKTPVTAYDKDMNVIGSWGSIVEAAKATGVSHNTIYCTVSQKNTKPVNGIIWLKTNTIKKPND